MTRLHALARPGTLTRRRSDSGRLWVALALACTLGAGGALAEGPRPADAAPDPAEAARRLQEAEQEQVRRRNDLKTVEDALAAAAEARRNLEQDVASLRTDRARLNAALIETTRQAAATESRIEPLERRLATLTASETAIRRSLEGRREVIAEVLGALQRMGRHPPPAVLVRPEDMLAAVRTSILLGAVLPELRVETETLASDLAQLVLLRAAIIAERELLTGELAVLGAERDRVAALVSARQARTVETEQNLAAERERTAELGSRAKTLKELIERMEREVAAARRGAEDARRAAEVQARETRERFAASAFRDPARLAPKVPFPEAKGLLPRPVGGSALRAFGASDGYGGTTRGISFAARRKSVVSSPCDGWVAYAGPFRSFGRLLIINAGSGYYLLLAGMEQISVEVGQFVLAGEPVATMGETSSLSPAAGAVESDGPVLYVEFRKDGSPVDPGPWWSKPQGEKVRG